MICRMNTTPDRAGVRVSPGAPLMRYGVLSDWRYITVFHGLAWLVYGAVYYADVRLSRPPDYWQVVLVATVSGSLLCGLLAVAYATVRQQSLLVKVAVALAASLSVAVLWSLTRQLFFNDWYAPGQTSEPLLSVRSTVHSLNALLFWSALYFFYDSYRLARDSEIRSLRAESLARESQLKVLSYQLNPHFLFNVLNSISAMSLKNDNTAAYDTTVRLAEFLRYALHGEPWRKVPLSQELECVERYLDIQLSRFEDRLTVDYDVPSELLSATVPNLILQPLIENAIKHTIESGLASVHIEIRASTSRGKLCIDVDNSTDGTTSWQPAENGVGLGLSNVRGRLNAYYGEAAAMDTDRTSDRYSVQLMLPLEPVR